MLQASSLDTRKVRRRRKKVVTELKIGDQVEIATSRAQTPSLCPAKSEQATPSTAWPC